MAYSSGKPLQTIKYPQRPSLLLKDYLIRDDLSSCSSSSFKSFPRRQCCITVRFPFEKDLHQLQRKRRNRPVLGLGSSSAKSTLQRASEAAINAIKSLPLSQRSSKAKSLLSRSLSRKLLSRSFWRKAAAKEEGNDGTPRWKKSISFQELLIQGRDLKTTSHDASSTIFTATGTTTSSGCDSNSGAESEFTCSSSATFSESPPENDVVVKSSKEDAPLQKMKGSVTPRRDCPNEEKEQFSPVSVLDFPFEDEEEITSHFHSTTRSHVEGTEHKHMQSRRHFEGVVSLEPVDLEKRIALSELEDEPYNYHSTQEDGNRNVLIHDKLEENARDLFNHVKGSILFNNCLTIKAENLLFDYFKQSIGENNIHIDIEYSKKHQHLCKVAEDWIRGEPQDQYLDWEVKEARQVYIREMDKCWEWRNSDQELQQLALELEYEVFKNLVNELVLDLTM